MSENKSANEQSVTSRGYNAGGLVAFPRPDDIVVPLRREEFDILCEGGVGRRSPVVTYTLADFSEPVPVLLHFLPQRIGLLLGNQSVGGGFLSRFWCSAS